MNHMTTTLFSGLILGTSIIGFGCDGLSAQSPTDGAAASKPPRVFAVNFPLQSFAQTIGGSKVAVESPSLDGGSSINFDPTPEQIITIQDAKLIILNGADFASWTANASLPSSRTVVTAEEFRSQWLESTHDHHHHDHDHQHGPEGDGVHHHAHWASYTWLDPNHARDQAVAIGTAMRGTLRAAELQGMSTRLDALLKELGALCDQAAKIRTLKLPPVIASEPVYQYLAAGCSLDMHEADWHWNEPQPHGGMDGLRNLIEATGARHLLVPEAPTSERLEVLRGLGLEPVVVMPLADPPSAKNTESFSELMKGNLDRLEALAVTQPAG